MRILLLAILAFLAFAGGFWLTQTLQDRQHQPSRSGSSRRSTQSRRAPLSPPTPSSQAALAQEVRSLLAQHQKIAALRVVRQETGWNLKKTKDYVEQIERAESLANLDFGPISSADLAIQVRQLLAQRQKIAAIKLVREHTRWGLKEAKDYVEQIEAQG